MEAESQARATVAYPMRRSPPITPASWRFRKKKKAAMPSASGKRDVTSMVQDWAGVS